MTTQMNNEQKRKMLERLIQEIQEGGLAEIDNKEPIIIQVIKDIFGDKSRFYLDSLSIKKREGFPISYRLDIDEMYPETYYSLKFEKYMNLIKQAIAYLNILPKRSESQISSNKTMKEIIDEDIDELAVFLENPEESKGRSIYSKVTAQYDGLVENLGHGLYHYNKLNHFYDPDIDLDTLRHNLNNIYNKLIVFRIQFIEKESDKKNRTYSNDKVFIVHGHDDGAKAETARTIESLGLNAIILHEKASSGATIIEKIENYSDVGFAVVLYTPCDYGNSIKKKTANKRARQNVVFEHGYLIAKLGRKRVCAIVKGDVETPGDISGVVYIPMDDGGAWRYKLIEEMNAVGFKLNKNSVKG